MKKLLSLFIKAVICVAVLSAGVYIADTVLGMADPWKNKVPEEVTDFGSPHKFYYDNLSDTEKHAYNELISNVYTMPEKIRIPDLDKDGLDNVFSALLADNPDLFFVARRCTLISQGLYTYCAVEYYIDNETYLRQKSELEEVCKKVISSLPDTDDEFRKELAIHDYIIGNCTYRLEEDEFVYSSSYGALVNGEAGCEGYSKATKLLMDMAGMESAVVSGVSSNSENEAGRHMWNAVRVNGDFYHLDCTWDDPVTDNGNEMLTYSYFNLSDEMIADTHSEFSYDFNCDSESENYFVKTNSSFDSYGRSDEKRLVKIISDKLNVGEKEVHLSFANKEAYDDAVSELIDSGRIYAVLRNVKGKTRKEFSTNSLFCSPDPERRVLIFVIE